MTGYEQDFLFTFDSRHTLHITAINFMTPDFIQMTVTIPK